MARHDRAGEQKEMNMNFGKVFLQILTLRPLAKENLRTAVCDVYIENIKRQMQ